MYFTAVAGRLDAAVGARLLPRRHPHRARGLAVLRRLLQARPSCTTAWGAVQAAKHALAEGDFKLAAKRLVFARNTEPTNAAVLRLMTTAFSAGG